MAAMTDRSSGVGVRNIRAMFEARSENTSPPDSRGRSPAGSESIRDRSTSRPLSKVRASFVPVERGGQQQQLSPFMGARKASDPEEGPIGPRLTRLNSYGMNQGGVPGGLGTVLKGSPFEPMPSEKRDMRPTSNPRANSSSGPKPSAVQAALRTFGADAAEKAKTKMAEVKAAAPKLTTVQTGGGKGGSGPTSAKSAKSPKIVKTPTTPKGAAAEKSKPAAATKDASSAKTPASKTSRPSLNAKPTPGSAPKATQHQTASSAAKQKPATSQNASPAQPSSTTPKAATRPSRLPASLTAPTASSAAKHDAASPSSRSSSAMRTGRPSEKDRNSSLRQKSSRSSLRSRSSLAAARTKEQQQHPTPPPPAPAPDESFLARMMRPTQSSASKVNEKVEPKSPPRGKPLPILAAKGKPPVMHGKKKAEAKDAPSKTGAAAEEHGEPGPVQAEQNAPTGSDIPNLPSLENGANHENDGYLDSWGQN